MPAALTMFPWPGDMTGEKWVTVMGDGIASRIGWGIVLGGHAFDLGSWQEACRTTIRTVGDGNGGRADPPLEPARPRDHVDRGSEQAREGTDRAGKWRARREPSSTGSSGLRVSRKSCPTALAGVCCRRFFLKNSRCKGQRSRCRSWPRWQAKTFAMVPAQQPPTVVVERRRSDLLADPLTYFARGNDWFDIYKALECLILRTGGGREKEFLDLGWADADEITRLKRTANSERHARRKFDPPRSPMRPNEARDLLAKLMARAFHEADTVTARRGMTADPSANREGSCANRPAAAGRARPLEVGPLKNKVFRIFKAGSCCTR